MRVAAFEQHAPSMALRQHIAALRSLAVGMGERTRGTTNLPPPKPRGASEDALQIVQERLTRNMVKIRQGDGSIGGRK
jgi:hypothetical protein